MRIAVSRSGGIAGMTRRAVVDTTGRPDADAWASLAAALPGPADNSAAATGSGPGRVRDAFVWTIEVDDQHEVRRCVLGDTELDGHLRELAERTLSEGHPA